MHNEVPPHQKVRFRRGDIADLDKLPSAMPPQRSRALPSVPRGAAKLAAGLVLAGLAIVALGYATIVSGIGEERLRLEAQSAIAALAGKDRDARIGAVRVSFDGPRMLALEVSDARIVSADTGVEVMRVGSARFGLRFLPLARGEVKLGGLRLGDARVELAALPRAHGAALPFLDDAGLVDPDAAIAALFDGVRGLFAGLGGRDIDRVALENVEIVLPVEEPARLLRVASAVLESGGADALALDATIELAGRIATLAGQASREPASGAIETLSVTLDAPLADAARADTIAGHAIGPLRLALTARERAQHDQVVLTAHLGDTELALGRDPLPLEIGLNVSADRGSGKLEIDRLRLASGRSVWDFHGAIGPAPVSAGLDADPAYRFELVSDGSMVAPHGSPEPSLALFARLAGHLDADAWRLDVTEIGMRSEQGAVQGRAALRFEAAKAPGIDLRLDVAGMPVGQVKQLWPWFAARGARDWALANVYGGRVESGRVDFAVPPGRLGNGDPLDGDEISGRFVVRGTRFDVAGLIPPMRDGNGAIAFRGSDVDITLDSGSVFMSGGRTVAASNGEFVIRDAHLSPVIGKLRIDVAGNADAVMALASHEPIDVGRFVDIRPQDLSGEVRGVVTADIPLQRGIPLESLDWRVDLDYKGLALARPFQGHAVSAAEGSISVDPARAVISARADLNGMPATLELVEPLGRGGDQRQRRIAMEMDDRARRAIAPGLDVLLTGTAKVELDEGAREGQAIRANLDRATLSIPWVGWSKGSGVPAAVAFAMATSGNRTELSDFRLSGDTFGATGALSLVGGEVIRARFPSARLNRSDDFSFDMKAEGGGYAITIRGASIDARSVVKLYAQDSSGGASSGGGAATPVTIDLEVAAMTGFNGEVLRNVRLSYSGTGARTDLLEFSGVTGSGRPVSFRDGRSGGTRTVTIRSSDAGAVLRFLDIYERMEGGDIMLSLTAVGDGPLTGHIGARDFWIVNEPRLRSIVSTAPAQDGRSLNQAVRGEIDTQRVHFERGFTQVVKGTGYLNLERGVLRGPLIGATFQGTLYDRQDNMAMTGTFMPAYGLNRIFGEIPLIGQILGNGRDRGLIGITFRLAGRASDPQLQVNPLSVIAPGIFRSVFEFR